jgi:hypothetical protein
LVALLALGAAQARADYDPLGSGATKLTFDKGFLALLKKNDVKLSVIAPAQLKRGVLSFPVSGGKFDPTDAKGTVEHEGALLFKDAAGLIPLRELQLKSTSKHSPLSAKVGGGQLKLVRAGSLEVSREGFGDKVKAGSLTLSAKLATRLTKKLRLRGVFEEGQPLGQTVTRAQPETITVLGKGKAELTLDAGIVAKLQSLFVAVNPIFGAEHVGSVFTLPIFGGTIAPDASIGTIETQGAMEFLQLGGGQIFWREPRVDLSGKALDAEIDAEPAPPYQGKVGRLRVAGLSLAASAVADAKARIVTVGVVPLVLDAATAAGFNEVFAKPLGRNGVFVAGEALGSLTFTVQGQ